jgi:hypothetical protein
MVNHVNNAKDGGQYCMTAASRATPPTMSPDPKSAEIETNYAAFRARLPDLVQSHAGKYAVLRHGDIVEFFDTLSDAAKFCGREYADGLFSIQEVTSRRVDLGYYSHAVHHASV